MFRWCQRSPLLRDRAALAAENLALRQQLAAQQRIAKRPRLRRRERIFWVWLSKLWPDWQAALLIVKPGMVVRWHRLGFRRGRAIRVSRSVRGSGPVRRDRGSRRVRVFIQDPEGHGLPEVRAVGSEGTGRRADSPLFRPACHRQLARGQGLVRHPTTSAPLLAAHLRLRPLLRILVGGRSSACSNCIPILKDDTGAATDCHVCYVEFCQVPAMLKSKSCKDVSHAQAAIRSRTGEFCRETREDRRRSRSSPLQCR